MRKLIFVTLALIVAPIFSSATAAGLHPSLTKLKDSKTFEGYNPTPENCDVSRMRGWFYYYRLTNGRCITVRAANPDEASTRATEILESSFSVIKAGYGFQR